MKYLIAGLGNPGEKYEKTRHNIGFKVLDALADASNTVFKAERYAHKAVVKHKGRQLVLIKPTTYMNRSGTAVRYWLDKENISTDSLLVIVDDIALPFGYIRIKANGSDGNHNGIFDIIETLGHQQFARLRFGIGNDFPRGMQSEYVLSNWTKNEGLLLKDRIEKMTEAVKSFSFIGIQRTMNFYNEKFNFDQELKKLQDGEGN